MAADDQASRLTTELSLLQSMYPEQITYHPQSQELVYTRPKGKLELRIPDEYLGEDPRSNSLPEVLSAAVGKTDQRDELKAFVEGKCAAGEEVLDSIIGRFDEVVADAASIREGTGEWSSATSDLDRGGDAKASVVIYLHHLLNADKRKRCVSPSSALVSGVTKPGYPGVLVFSGPKVEVYEHVNELKGLKWQAFQVRLESEKEWVFEHGEGVIEVETMKDVVADVGEEKKGAFMEAMRMKSEG